ncbi:hypothetical protein Psta_3277 [Pirellula staleyi DSM 6068]|uniref:Uncharacterized protein n=1 Tax=Pirellula staleyi (strain ATCC 27377 / DSM 6068 / ICPB 4128) TaxID=530564 RepID=D2QXA1_PIRSD|nr:hypothetical protein Psta_3277 [Pirellula staleyi DSM 6068]
MQRNPFDSSHLERIRKDASVKGKAHVENGQDSANDFCKRE